MYYCSSWTFCIFRRECALGQRNNILSYSKTVFPTLVKTEVLPLVGREPSIMQKTRNKRSEPCPLKQLHSPEPYWQRPNVDPPSLIRTIPKSLFISNLSFYYSVSNSESVTPLPNTPLSNSIPFHQILVLLRTIQTWCLDLVC